MMEKNTIHKKKGQTGNINIKDIFRLILSNWYWFVLSVLVFGGYAYYKVKKLPYIYYRQASILIKDQTSSTRTGDASSSFYEISTLRLSSSIQNEILIFKSKRLMTEVVRNLNLNTYYSRTGRFREWDLYGECPVTISFPDAQDNATFSLKAVPVDSAKVLLTDFSVSAWDGKPIQVALNDTVETPVGKAVVTPSLFYSPEAYNQSFNVRRTSIESAATQYNNALQVSVMSNGASMIKLGISDVSARRAEDIINTLINVYNQDAINDKNRISVNTANFINERLIVIEKELGGVESEIATFKSQHRLTDIESQTGSFVESSNRFQQESMELSNQLTLTKYIRDYLVDPSKSNELIPSNTGISDINIEGQISKYNALMLERDKLLANSSLKNPVVMDLNNTLAAMKQTMIRTVDNLLAALRMKLGNIRSEEARAIKRIAAVPSQQKYVLSVERQQKIKESLYIYLLNKREENALIQSMAENNARVIDPAMGSNAPVSPNGQQIMMIWIMIGLALPAAIIFLINVLDTSVRTKQDVIKALSVPFLGEIPERTKAKKGSRLSIVVKPDSKDPVSEAFKILRANMSYMNGSDHRIKTIMVTSFRSGAGKTFISSNFGVTLALAGYKVVLVDLDIRKGTMSSTMKHKKTGVTNYLAGYVDNVDDLILQSEQHENLSIISSGPEPPNPSELLLSDRFTKLTDELKKRFDYIILDNVPSNVVADAMIVNRVADITLYVIRAGRTERNQLDEIEQLYTDGKFRNMAIVLNGVKKQNFVYGYSYGYGYGYGYGPAKKRKDKS